MGNTVHETAVAIARQLDGMQVDYALSALDTARLLVTVGSRLDVSSAAFQKDAALLLAGFQSGENLGNNVGLDRDGVKLGG